MFLKRLFRKAPPPAAPRSRTLADAALDDGNVTAQREACRTIEDIAVLRQAAEQAVDPGTRDLANARFRRILCGLPGGAAGLDAAIAEIARITDPAELGQIALGARAPELRRAAIDKLPADAQELARCAVEDALSSHRQLAVERIDARPLLEHVVKHIGKKDTKVYRIAREKLRALVQQEERPRLLRERADELCEALDRLGRHNNWIQDRARLSLLDKQWADIAAELEPSNRDRYAALRARFLAEFEAHSRASAAAAATEQTRAQALARKQRLVERLEKLAQETDPETLAAELAEIGEAWSASDAEFPTAPPLDRPADSDNTAAHPGEDRELAALRAAGQAALERAIAQQQRLGDRRHRADALEQLRVQAEQLLATSGPIDQQLANKLQRQLAQFRPDLDAERAADGNALGDLLDRLERRLSKQKRHAERKLSAAPEQLEALAAHLDAGELRKAEPLFQKISATLDQARTSGLPRSDINRIDKKLKQSVAPLRELQRWRRWSADQHREALCHEAELLAASPADTELATLATRLNGLRRDWRRIDKSGTPASDGFWNRFKEATEQVATRCEPYVRARAERLRASQEARRQLCDKLEHFLAAVDWDSVDWKAMVKAEREMRQAWNALDIEQDEGRGRLEGRFRRGLGRVDKALKEERARNQTHKRALIERMQALGAEQDLETAIANAKALQRDWHTTVPGRQSEENALWQEFRAASDAVFARRHQQRAARHQELQEHVSQWDTLCADAEALANGQSPSTDLAAAWKHLAQRWQDARSLPVPQHSRKSLEPRWAAAQEAIERRLEWLKDQSDWHRIERLKQRSDFLSRHAQDLMAGRPLPPRDRLQADWQALSRTDSTARPHPDAGPGDARADEAPADPRLVAGFNDLMAALDDPAAKAQIARQLEANAKQREELCLRLEILARVDSPPELVPQRMALQVERLQEKLREGDAGSLTQSKEMLKDWYLAAPAPQDPALEARLRTVEKALRPDSPAEP